MTLERPAYTVSEFAERTGGTERTAAHYRKKLGRVERMMGRPLAEASERDLGALKKRLRGMRSGPHVAALVRMFYRAASSATDDLRYLKLAESMKLKQRVKRLSPDDVLTLPDVNAMLRAANSLRDRALIVALWETGARIHEVLAVDLADVAEIPAEGNGGRKAFRVFFRKVKVSGEEHAGYVLEGADHFEAWIAAHPRPERDAPLFPSYSGARLGRHGAGQTLKAIAGRAGVGKRVYPHLFRHSRATHLLRIGVPEPQVKRLLGWTPDSTMLSRYSHLATRDAYLALLRAHGIEVQETVDVGALVAAEGDLRPVIPMVRAPPKPPAEIPERDLEVLIDVRRALTDPRVLEAIRRALAAAEPEPAAPSSPN